MRVNETTDRPDQSVDFATLFETTTGQSTTTEHQQTDVSVRIDERGEESVIARSLDTTATVAGFDDVIDDPETR